MILEVRMDKTGVVRLQQDVLAGSPGRICGLGWAGSSQTTGWAPANCQGKQHTRVCSVHQPTSPPCSGLNLHQYQRESVILLSVLQLLMF